jgi:predicted transcriptional regulator of viral defense system
LILLAFFVEMDSIHPTYKYVRNLLSMIEKKNMSSACEKARRIIREGGGVIRTSEAIQAGIHSRTLYQLRDMGDLEQISRGIYRLAEIGTVSSPDFVIVATRIPISVICLISALSFHEITTQIPHEVSVAIPKDSKPPVIHYPPMQFHKFSTESFQAGVESHEIDGVTVKVYSPEKTLADCFKVRNKIGMDVVLEALKLYKSRMKFDHKKILEYARICRVDKIVLPYLEANI